jgi:hypothetical protein
MTETIPEVIAAMRARHDAMKPGGARNGLKHWLERFEAAVEPAAPAPKPLLTGTFDNRQTNRRELWEHGRLGPTLPAERCPRNRPFGTYQDVEGV